MPVWTCPDCARPLGRRNQSHHCAPGLGVDEYLAAQPQDRLPVWRAALDAFATIDGVVVEPVAIGILFKRRGTFAELRPKQSAVELSFKLSRKVDHPRVRRVVKSSVHRFAHFVWLTTPGEVDRQVREWLVEAWADSPV